MHFTCPGIARARAAENKVVKLAVDGKQKVVSNDCTTLTVSFLVPSESVAQTRARPSSRAGRTQAHTCTQEPFLQALVSSESARNMHTINTACDVAEQQCGLDLRNQVLQVQKDDAKGIEALRKKVFPNSRTCDDYAHMRSELRTALCRVILALAARSRSLSDAQV